MRVLRTATYVLSVPAFVLQPAFTWMTTVLWYSAHNVLAADECSYSSNCADGGLGQTALRLWLALLIAEAVAAAVLGTWAWRRRRQESEPGYQPLLITARCVVAGCGAIGVLMLLGVAVMNVGRSRFPVKETAYPGFTSHKDDAPLADFFLTWFPRATAALVIVVALAIAAVWRLLRRRRQRAIAL